MSVLQVARKLAMVEADLERAEERAEAGESYVAIAKLAVHAFYVCLSLPFLISRNELSLLQVL